ncbi:hypothetical protein BHU72_03310 [Desulfuribacillus stibiiarsenatis]|uniref:Magnesium transporter MgtE intracellular domain-containing protein n=1 Tax=Desulfuribacillus stibiiarsenatis TaxID=1390249 RepID=A0A1E5L6M8_9FIRM|nr:hypothetical protein [Desulfuribacillus stibiiarsenatis]OEH85822.1 hypothetical protein BHU72_03310 [Desulfuribacillus stibiiarsenatis]
MAENTEVRSYSKLEWLFYIIILPMLFTAVLSGVFMSFLGYDVGGTIRDTFSSVPVIRDILPEVPETELPLDEKVVKLETEIKDLEDSISQKDVLIEELNASIEQRNLTITDLEQKMQEINNLLDDKMADRKSWEDKIAELSKMYSSMPPNRAAPIISALPEMEAIQILNAMTSGDRAKVMEKMTPAKAASITSLLATRPDSDYEEVAVLLAKIDQLNLQLEDKQKREDRAKELARLYSTISEDRSAEILSLMTNGEAVDILKQMTLAKRSALLEKMPSNRAAQLTQLLLN